MWVSLHETALISDGVFKFLSKLRKSSSSRRSVWLRLIFERASYTNIFFWRAKSLASLFNILSISTLYKVWFPIYTSSGFANHGFSKSLDIGVNLSLHWYRLRYGLTIYCLEDNRFRSPRAGVGLCARELNWLLSDAQNMIVYAPKFAQYFFKKQLKCKLKK